MAARPEGGLLGNEEVQDRRRSRVKALEARKRVAWLTVMQTAAGRLVLADVIRAGGLGNVDDATRFIPDARLSEYAAGRRSLAAYVVARMRGASVPLFRAMEDETIQNTEDPDNAAP